MYLDTKKENYSCVQMHFMPNLTEVKKTLTYFSIIFMLWERKTSCEKKK
jgi:hypothetical protein